MIESGLPQTNKPVINKELHPVSVVANLDVSNFKVCTGVCGALGKKHVAHVRASVFFKPTVETVLMSQFLSPFQNSHTCFTH